MIERALAKLLVVLGLLSMVFLFVFRDSIRGSIPAALPKILSGSRDQRPDFGPTRPTVRVTAKKAQTKTKQIPKREEILPRDIPVLEIVVPSPPFPSRSEVSVSMSRAELIAKFGEPDASATWSDEGTLRERLIYQSQERYTEILLQGGRVASTRRDIPVR